METTVPRGRRLGMSLGDGKPCLPRLWALQARGESERRYQSARDQTPPMPTPRTCARRSEGRDHKRAGGWLSTRSRTSGLSELHSAGPHFPQLRARDPRPLQVPCRAGVPTLEAGALVFLVAADDVSSARRTRSVLLALEVAVHRVAIDRSSARIADHLDAAPDTVAVDA
jgi:hypothetical protein